jgi:hypothetical protein
MKSQVNRRYIVDKTLGPQPRCLLVNLLDTLEAENSRLRRTVVELSLDTLALREALNGDGCHE